MTDNRRYLVSRNKCEGWYFCFDGKTRTHEIEFSLKTFAKRRKAFWALNKMLGGS